MEPTSRQYPLRLRKIIKKVIVLEFATDPKHRRSARHLMMALFGLAVAYGIASVAASGEESVSIFVILGPIIGVLVVLVALIIFYETLYLWRYYYHITNDYVMIRKGVLIRKEITLSFDRIHDVYLDQDPMDFVLRLYDLHMATATDQSVIEAHIDGLNYSDATMVRDLILQRVAATHAPRLSSRITKTAQ